MTPPFPIRTLGWLAAAGGVVLLAGTAAQAQEAPPGQPAPQPGALSAQNGGDQGVALTYKYKTGNIQRFRAETNGNLTISPEGGGGGGLGPIPLALTITTYYTEKVTGTNQGTGTLSTQLSTMNMVYNVFGTNAEMRYANGKVTSLVNGQPSPQAAGAPGMERLAQLRKPVVVHKDPRGGVSMVTQGAAGTASPGVGELFGGANVSVMTLPDHPVKVGDSWETTQQIQPNIPVPNGGASAVPMVEIKFTHTLKSLGTRNGKVYALIDSTGSGASPEGAPGGSVNENFTGTTRFDVARGAVASGKYNVEVSIKLPAATLGAVPPAGAPGAAAAPPNMRIDGSIQMVLMEAAPPAAKAGAKGKRTAARKRR